MNHSPGINLYDSVRAGFIVQGTTFGKWCKENAIVANSARQCLIGTWNGPKGSALRDKVVKASKIEKLLSKDTLNEKRLVA